MIEALGVSVEVAVGIVIGGAVGAFILLLPLALFNVYMRRREERDSAKRVKETLSKPAITSGDPLYSPGLRGDREA